MRFVGYTQAHLRGAKIDWDAAVDADDRVRRALHPLDVEQLRSGRLRRPLHVTPPTPGRRGRRTIERHAPREAMHEAGALVFASADESWFFVEVTGEDD